jgi:hypothetical protein
MKLVNGISTAALILLLGTTASVYAQKGQKDKGGGEQKAQQGQRGGGQKEQHAQRNQQPKHTQQAQRSQRQPQHSQQAQRTQRQPQRVAYNRGNNGFHGNGNNGHHYGRIPDDRYRAHFGNAHSFRMIRPRMINGYQRFQYSGYWFGFNEQWPSDWYYTDDVYVEYVDSSYYLYNRRHPGIHITLNLF